MSRMMHISSQQAPVYIYEFKITLNHSNPTIWRRIQVPELYNFHDLHLAIQFAMGWKSGHMHQFDMNHPRTSKEVSIGFPNEEGFSDYKVLSEKRVKISNYFTLLNNMALYTYDFGDGWEHEILLERILTAVANTTYPKCVDGERACPPEDCGGIYGYKYLLEIIANPQHREYAEKKRWLNWIGYNEVNPDHFDPRFVGCYLMSYVIHLSFCSMECIYLIIYLKKLFLFIPYLFFS